MDESRAPFTYIWEIENASRLHFAVRKHKWQSSFCSPIFTVDSVEKGKTRWQLTIIGIDWLTFFIQRVEDDEGPKWIEMEYEISILSGDGYPLVKRMDRNEFENNSNHVFQRFAKSEDIFNVRKDEFLPKDTLRVRCRMWRLGTSKTDLCYARTVKRVDSVSFNWTINNFSTLQQNEKRVHFVNFALKVIPQLILSFHLEEIAGEEHAFIHIAKGDVTNPNLIQGKISLLDINGRIHHSTAIEECVSPENDANCLSETNYSKKVLMTKKETLLPNDTLTFRCEFEIDTEPFCYQIEQYSEFNSSEFEIGIPEIEFTEVHGPYAELQRFFSDCYKRGTFCDAYLRADSRTFPVHRLILSACSSIFKAMFAKDTQEDTKRYLDIPDVDADTLDLMLSYIYTNTVPELPLEKAVDLFTVADKYELEDLKEKCSEFLRSNISDSNYCKILTVADIHHDYNLKTAVHDFIFKYCTEIFKSDVWKTFKSSNRATAMDTVERIACFIKTTEDCGNL